MRHLYYLAFLCILVLVGCNNDELVTPFTEIKKIEITPKTLVTSQESEINFVILGVTTNSDTLEINSPNFISTDSKIILVDDNNNIFSKNPGAAYVYARYNDLTTDSAFVIVNNYNSTIKKVEIFPKTAEKYVDESFGIELKGITYFDDTISIDISYLKSINPNLVHVNSDKTIFCKEEGQTYLYVEYKGITSDSLKLVINDPTIKTGDIPEQGVIHQTFTPPIRFSFSSYLEVDYSGNDDFKLIDEYSWTLSGYEEISISPTEGSNFELIYNPKYKTMADSMYNMEKSKSHFFPYYSWKEDFVDYWCADLDSDVVLNDSCNWTGQISYFYVYYKNSSNPDVAYSSPKYKFLDENGYRYIGIRRKNNSGIYLYGWLKISYNSYNIYVHESVIKK
jgi:hypothetical protein